MPTIRNAQLHVLERQARERFVAVMLDHLYSHFPDRAWSLTPDELTVMVNKLIDRAVAYQLNSHQQVCRFINLAATYGWELDRDPALRWMRRILEDASPSQPSERLDRLLETCLHRQNIEEQNLALRRLWDPAGVVEPVVPGRVAPEDFIGMHCYGNTDDLGPDSEELLARNPLSYHLSRSLWHRLESVSPGGRNQAALGRVNDMPALLRSITGAAHRQRK